MDKIERARELYRTLEGETQPQASEIAQRAFFIQEMLSENGDSD